MTSFQEILFTEGMKEMEGTEIGLKKYENSLKSLIRGKTSDMILAPKFTCGKCSGVFFNKTEYEKHLKIEKQGNVNKYFNPYAIGRDLWIILNFKSRQSWDKSKDPKKFEKFQLDDQIVFIYWLKWALLKRSCKFCEKRFKFSIALKKHQEKRHPEKFLVPLIMTQCEKCCSTFIIPENFELHKCKK